MNLKNLGAVLQSRQSQNPVRSRRLQSQSAPGVKTHRKSRITELQPLLDRYLADGTPLDAKKHRHKQMLLEAESLGIYVPSQAERELQQLIEVARVYYQCLKEYWNRPYEFGWEDRLKASPQKKRFFREALSKAEGEGARLRDWVVSQFWWFERAYGKPPRITNLSGRRATERYYDWARAKAEGENASKVIAVDVRTRHPILEDHGGRSIVNLQNDKHGLRPEVQTMQEKTLRHLIRQLGSEAEVWEKHGGLGNQLVFLDAFKATREAWRAMFLTDDEQPDHARAASVEDGWEHREQISGDNAEEHDPFDDRNPYL